MDETYGEAKTRLTQERLEHRRRTHHEVAEATTFGGYSWACSDCDEERQISRSDFETE